MANYFNRTDLAIEAKESFPKDQVEISGVALEEETDESGTVKVTTVEIKNEHGANAMKKPIGIYVTLEFQQNIAEGSPEESQLVALIGKMLKK